MRSWSKKAVEDTMVQNPLSNNNMNEFDKNVANNNAAAVKNIDSISSADSEGINITAPTPVDDDNGAPSREIAWKYHLQGSASRLIPGDTELSEFDFAAPTGRFCHGCDLFNEKYKSEFSIFGAGVTSFFKFEKYMAWMWSIMTLFAFPAIVINTYGPGDETSQPANGIAMTTLRNMYARNGLANSTFTLPFGFEITQTTAAAVYTGCDFVSCILFIIGYLWMRSYLRMEQKAVDTTILTVADFSIYLPFVPQDTTKDDIAEWINAVTKTSCEGRIFPIVDINVIENDSSILRLMEKRARLISELIRVQQKLRYKNAGKMTFSDEFFGCFSALSLEDDAVKLQRRIKQCIDKVVKIKITMASKAHLETQACAAFVTFESNEDADTFRDLYPDDSTAEYLCQPRRLRFKGKRIVVFRAPEPSAVQWGNLQVTSTQQFVRTTLSNMFSLWVIIFSFLLIFFASWKANEYESLLVIGDCKSREVTSWVRRYTAFHTQEEEWDLRNGTGGTSANALNIFCLCDTLGWSEMTTKQEVESSPWFSTCKNQACDRLFNLDPQASYDSASCHSWTQVKANALTLSIFASLAILVVNQSLGLVLRFLAEFEGHHSVEFRDESVSLRLFFAQFFNTAVLMILINIAWPVTAVTFSTSRYTDITAGWYDNIGAQLMTTMVINWISPHAYYLVSGCVLRYRIHKQNIHAWSQQDMNERYLGYPMDLALRHAQLINVAFVTYSFSTGMPLLMPIGAVSFFLAYWVDKTLFIRYYSKVPLTSNIVTKTMSGLLPMAMLLHLGFGVWMLGAISTFNSALSRYSPLDYEAWLAPFIGKVGVDAPIDNLMYEGGEPFFVVNGIRFNTSAQLEAYYYNTSSVPETIGIPPYQRIFSSASIPLLVLFILVWIVYFLSSVAKLMFKGIVGCLNLVSMGAFNTFLHDLKHDGTVETVSSLFSVAVSEKVKGTSLRIVGIPTYNILAQPEIRRRLHVHPKLALMSNSLADVIFTDESHIDEAIKKAHDVIQAQLVAESVPGRTGGDGGEIDEAVVIMG